MAARTMVTVLTGLLVAAVSPAPAQPSAAPPEVIAKNLAENVLGEGTVTRVRVSGGGRFIEITWGTVLFKVANSQATNREQVKGEAQLATGSIMGVMRPEVIRYTIQRGPRTIAFGRRTRDGEFSISYSNELGG